MLITGIAVLVVASIDHKVREVRAFSDGFVFIMQHCGVFMYTAMPGKVLGRSLLNLACKKAR